MKKEIPLQEHTNKIYNEDCLLTMNRGFLVDAVITSPPYNTSRSGSSLDKPSANVRYDHFNDCKSEKDYINWTIDVFNGYNKILKPNGVVLYNLSYSSDNTDLIWKVIGKIIEHTNFTTADTIVWKKPSTSPNSSSPNKLTRICEFVFVFVRKAEIETFITNKEVSSARPTGQLVYKNYYNFIEAPCNDGSVDDHKATFSSKLVRRLLNFYAKKGSIVYDSFMGTGTTAVACLQDGYSFIGSELSLNYVNFSNKRISQLLSQQTLF